MTAALDFTIAPTTTDPAPIPVWDDVAEIPDDFGPCVVPIGVFDGMHRGHRRLVARARAVADQHGLPVVLVTFFPHPARVLGIDRDTATLSTIDHRAALAADAGADAVCVLPFTRDLAARTPTEFASGTLADGLRARAVVVGANFTFGNRGVGTLDTLHELGAAYGFTAHGVALLSTADTPCSSSYIRGRLRDGDLAAAVQALGRPHRIHGHRSGDALLLDDNTALPPPGRYRVLADSRPATATIDAAGQIWLTSNTCAAQQDTVVAVDFLARRGTQPCPA